MLPSKVFLLLTLIFVFGIFIGSFFSISQAFVWLGALICVALIAIFFRRDSKILNRKIAFAAFLMLFLLFGITRFNLFHSRQDVLVKLAKAAAGFADPRLSEKIKVDVYGYIDSEPRESGKAQNFVFKSKIVNVWPKAIETNERILITTGPFPEYKFGQMLKINGVLRLPENFKDYDFDYVAYLAKDGIFTVLNFPEISGVDNLTPEAIKVIDFSWWEKIKIPAMSLIFKFKNSFENSVNRSISEPQAALTNGILTGSRHQISDEVSQAFQRTGTSHILAISGYNITIIAGVISWFLLLFMKRQVAFWFSVLGVVLFTILTGAQASVVRAAVMGILLLIAQKEGRLYGATNAIVFAGALMIFENPKILRYDIGFQLSFMATLGLIYLGPIFSKKFSKLPEFFKFRETFVMTLSAQLFVLPLLLFYFKNFSLVSLPANVLILPLIPYLMAVGFIAGALGMILGSLGQIVGYLAWFLGWLVIAITKTFSEFHLALLEIKFSWYFLIPAYVFLFWIIFRSKNKSRVIDS